MTFQEGPPSYCTATSLTRKYCSNNLINYIVLRWSLFTADSVITRSSYLFICALIFFAKVLYFMSSTLPRATQSGYFVILKRSPSFYKQVKANWWMEVHLAAFKKENLFTAPPLQQIFPSNFRDRRLGLQALIVGNIHYVQIHKKYMEENQGEVGEYPV